MGDTDAAYFLLAIGLTRTDDDRAAPSPRDAAYVDDLGADQTSGVCMLQAYVSNPGGMPVATGKAAPARKSACEREQNPGSI